MEKCTGLRWERSITCTWTKTDDSNLMSCRPSGSIQRLVKLLMEPHMNMALFPSAYLELWLTPLAISMFTQSHLLIQVVRHYSTDCMRASHLPVAPTISW